MGLLSGPSLTATLRISPVNLIQGSRAMLKEVEPVGDWGTGTTVRLMVGKREYSGADTTWTGPFNRSSRTGIMHTRVSSRVFELEVEISGSGWVHAQGLRTTEQPDGQQ